MPPDLPPSRQQDNPELPPQGQAQADEEEEEIGLDVVANKGAASSFLLSGPPGENLYSTLK